jgi:hypothetical protein
MADLMDKAAKAFKKEEQRREGVKNMAEFQQAQIAVEKKTERLRAMRLAHEAQMAEAELAAQAAKPKSKSKTRTRKKKSS